MVKRILNAIFGENQSVEEEEEDIADVNDAMHKARIKGHLSPEKDMHIDDKVKMCQRAIKKQTRNFKKNR